ncbi:hypothetical protein MJA45_28160 [Paenibacillus aurantius]|uniref:Uncharacterized protein n=1 Tax=Paenibacillus aurantius TaxID=2918900 RepID=A0AA96REZ3_9BACL|nr:hypothetical protein [Paenibacillus aurantius]WNQ11427.1 hypothetical protein MJA45_28160 [Paenibacillus aurantius]
MPDCRIRLYSLHWWVMLTRIVPWGIITNISFVYGVFFVGILLIFPFTYPRFWLYLIVNLVVS